MKSFHSFRRATLAALALAGTAGLVSSCKDYLEVDPIALNTTEYTFSSVSGATAAVIGAYDPLSGDNGYGTRVSMYYPLDSDELIGSAGAADGGRRSIARYTALATNTEINNPWNQLYQGVERSNICIQQIPQMPLYTGGTATEQAALKRLHGEALTLRAQYLFELVRNWGDVPVQFTPAVSGQDFNLPNSDRNATLTRLIADLKLAEDLLPWRSQAGAASERITKGAAKALRARISLFRGGYSLQGNAMQRPGDYLDYYRIARQECADLMTTSARAEHNLNPSFLEVFKSMNELRSEAANEIMFQVGMATATGASGSKIGYYNGPRLQNASGTYGSTQGAVTIAPPYFYAFDSTDTRRDVTITTYGIASTANVQTGVALTAATDGKWRRDWHIPPVTGTVNYLDYNWPIIRFADVLLMFAETENELNGPTTAAQDAFMEVRTRGFGGNRARALATLPTNSFGSKASMFNAIVNERYIEFGGEGIRKYDLLRWNLFETKIAEVKANIEKMALGQAPYDNVPLYQYYRTPTSASLAVQPVQWTRSFYRPSPTPNTAPTGTVRVNWRQGIDAAYVANTKPAGTDYVLPGTTTPVKSIASGLAAEYVPGRGKELLPIPQATLSADPALKQNFGY
ncbi:RagB/SusD family nutrient uptake outer membrane protein [Hymenobacter properus]|uniref:RagB/SusD family nutrient uptake outer membrane protein n=1 Tax=Hymenobacter properus TaxID=2791026 RepID=A0A931BJD0_9BACT|nr:RagB/SusD family nutrient uptake outer membrane protein [Hymenobacter properus]MBF9142417.1 RagB/SusD family nutrient uptake outer membrane protein [Hymenobacter properus]MBR7721224.1 RagB/SusD family nutrient uptake outer membrane protein [Microvirga sp. SRT04]